MTLEGADIYLVGGAVRDKLLNRAVHEQDWVVVGATPELMLNHHFKAVGKDFPVFLHPKTHEEYALARTERKTAPGYHGFAIHASPKVTLEQDLLRRDLTINAIARTAAGTLIDPYHGVDDLNKRLLRHVSPAFSEDPLRVLRVARFAARYHALGFRIAKDTLALMGDISKSGELETLAPERVWQETVRALGEAHPVEYFVHCAPVVHWSHCFQSWISFMVCHKSHSGTRKSIPAYTTKWHCNKPAGYRQARRCVSPFCATIWAKVLPRPRFYPHTTDTSKAVQSSQKYCANAL